MNMQEARDDSESGFGRPYHLASSEKLLGHADSSAG